VDLLEMIAATGSSGLLTGAVAGLTGDGTIEVRCDRGVIPCDLLLTGETPVALEIGDTVLFWAGETRGVVLGKIGTYRVPESPEPEKELLLEARENLTLRCGEGSITIRADGKILIKGIDLVSRAERMNRIKGGAVSIN
jgi:hypothetical protein